MRYEIDHKPATENDVGLIAQARGELLSTMIRQLALYSEVAESGDLDKLAEVVIRDAASLQTLLESMGENQITRCH
ncbi:hypothetical protein Q6D67_12220 [Haliea sp. E1-2-M8]|uniref:hypothetical protein n=1 Tax=Haliea sp. E1-2-M8 TaxID=3064706 RepID=UPI0027215C87|nr:hypothetical protein [Haliea sp. E1-2-M8]MDO8862467.1 hypothetical protein [Haliea sp. E1-2-M8]